jgi:CO dehydrogenase maturation factor
MLGELLAGTDEVTVLDMEASIEHLSRGTVRHVDALLVVTEPYYRSLETAGRMGPLARELGIKHLYAVANKVRSERDEEAVREFCQRHDLELLATVPFDENILEADHQGVAILDFNPDAPAVQAIRRLAEDLEERLSTSNNGN